MASESADVDAADAANAEPASSCRRGDQDDCSPPPGPTLHIHGPSPTSPSNPPSSSIGSLREDSSKPRRTSFPVSFPPIFLQRSKVPSASLAASTAEGRPVPVTDPADANHTSALQKLNSKYPSAVRRHGYAPEASVARSSTYSQPVLVRTYSGPPPSQGSRSTKSRLHRPPSSSRGASRRVPLPSASTPGSGGPGRPIQPTLSDVGVGTTSSSSSGTHKLNIETYGSNAQGVNMPRPYKAKKATGTTAAAATTTSKLPLPWPWPLSSRQEPEEPKLPPLEAFSFKSFMADLETRGSDNNIGADLDRIAEICARSRYSLSNQYEVHVAPHGSGSSFTSGAPPSSVPRTRKGHSHSRSHSHGHGHGIAGPTLQAITSDDENATRSSISRRRNGGAKRRSAAYGTLETIMSSSRSSDEDKSKKKSAAELASEVRGRAARKTWDTPSASASSAAVSTGNSGSNADIPTGQQQQQQDPTLASATASATTDNNKLARKKSASFATAIMDTRNGRSAAAAVKTSPSPSSSDQHSKTNNKKTRRVRQEDEETTTTTTTTSTRAKPASSALLSEPAQPQTSVSHLGVRTSRGGRDGDRRGSVASAAGESGARAVEAGELPHLLHHQQAFPAAAAGGGRGVYSSWGAWMPWRAGQAQQGSGPVRGAAGVGSSYAEGSLRQLLRNGGDGQAERRVSRA